MEQYLEGKVRFNEERSPGKRDRRSAMVYSKEQPLYMKFEHFIKHLMETALTVHDSKKDMCKRSLC